MRGEERKGEDRRREERRGGGRASGPGRRMEGHGSGTSLPGDGAGAACERGLWAWRGCQSLKQSALLLFFNLAFWRAHSLHWLFLPRPPSSISLCLTDQRSTKRGKHTRSKIKIGTPLVRQNKLEQTNYRQSTHKQWSICGSLDEWSRWLPPTPPPPPPPIGHAHIKRSVSPHSRHDLFKCVLLSLKFKGS